MPDPITLGTIATLAGKAAIGALAAMPVKAATGKLTQKARNVLTKGPLTGPLEKALSAASLAFIDTLDVDIADEQTRANLKEMVEDQRWAHAVAQLPLLHPEKIDTSSCKELFEALGPEAAPAADFDVGWQRLIKGFQNAVAASGSQALQAFVEISATAEAARQRDQQIELSARQTEILEQPLKQAQNAYLRSLWAELHPLPLMGIGQEGSRSEDIPLSAVYTALDVTAEIRVSLSGKKARPGADIEEPTSGSLRGDPRYLKQLQERVVREAIRADRERRPGESYSRRWSALEAVAAVPGLVLLGPAGSGKSTFARYLALSLAGEALGRGEANLKRLHGVDENELPAAEELAWPHGAVLPVFVELRKLVRSEAFPPQDEKGTADHLLAYLEDGQKVSRSMLLAAFAKPGGALVILDGLDETPAAEASRGRLKEIIASLRHSYPECRVLLTCRPYAYQTESSWRLDAEGFEQASLAPFDPAKRRAFIAAWYHHLAARKQIDAEQAERRGAQLSREIESSSYLVQLAERPLMLTMMTDLHASSGGRLPGGRAGLYERSVDLLLDRWNELRGVLGEGSLADHLGMTPRQIRLALEGLAYEVHRQRGGESGSEPSDITPSELWQALDARRPRPLTTKVDERQVMDYLQQRSGILVGESASLYRFPHRSYQEYMAACHLVRTDFPRLVLREIQAEPELWREVLLLAAGSVAEKTPFTAWALLEGLVPKAPEDDVGPEDARFLPALYAALAVRENGLWHEVQEQDVEKLERIRRWLERSLEVGALSPVDRATGGQLLAVLGDRRKGVALVEGGVPEIDWAEIPSGKFRMGSSDEDQPAYSDERPQHEVDVPAFRISRYLVTNAQYGAFVADGGYRRKWQSCWTKAGWKWKGKRQGLNDDLPPEYLLENHPRVNVTWHEAVAFCHWLGERLGEELRLPTEEEWEKAARGTDGRIYPWGDEFDAGCCNAAETGIGRPGAVGMFPGGASPYGVLDLSGNVWEWTLSEWTKDYSGQKGEIDLAAFDPADLAAASGAGRVIRGGGYWGGARVVRSAYRFGRGPGIGDRSRGFRVLAVPPRA